jgi:hypothetical protein
MHELGRLLTREWSGRERERVCLAAAPARTAREQLRAGRADDEQRHAGGPVDEVVDAVEQPVVRPVEVFEHEDERALVGDALEEPSPGRERLVLARGASPGVVVDSGKWAEVRERPVDVVRRDRLCDDVLELPFGLFLGVRLEDPGVGLDHLAERPEADALTIRKRAALAPVDELRVMLDRLEELVDEAALPDPGLADERHELGGADAPRALERVQQRVELALTADKWRPHAARDVDADARSRLYCLPRGDRLGFALRLHGLGFPVVDRVAGRTPGRLADEDAVDRGVRLQSRRGVDDVAGDHALALVRPCVERDQRLPRVDADAELELCLLVEDPVPDREPCADGTLGVVLVRDRSAEDGHHGVADELLHRASEALELIAEAGVVRPEERPDFLGIHLLRARREADEVGEEDGDHLALLQPFLRCGAEVGATGIAETCALGVLLPAAGACDHPQSLWRWAARRPPEPPVRSLAYGAMMPGTRQGIGTMFAQAISGLSAGPVGSAWTL